MGNLWVLIPTTIIVVVGFAIHQALYYLLFDKNERAKLKLKRQILNKGR